MVHDLQFAVDRMDNTQFEHHDFNDTSASEEVKEATMRGTVLVQTPSIPVENEDRSVKVGNKRRYQEMVTSSNPVVVNEQSNPSIKLNQRSQSPKIDDEQNMMPEIRT